MAIIAVSWALTACGGDDSPAPARTEIAPTRTLVLSTLTPTVPSVPGVPTPTDLPAPGALAPNSGSVPAEAYVGQEVVAEVLTALVADQDVAMEEVRLLSLESFTWQDESWGCQSRSAVENTETIETPGYRVIFNAKSRVFVYHTDTTGTFFRCADQDWLALEGEPVITEPVAGAMVAMSRRDAARRAVLGEDSLQLVSLLTLIWPDASLGCPQPGLDYPTEATPGYRIVFRWADQQFIYHASARQVVPCTPEEEILSGELRRALPAPVSTPAPD